MPPTEHPYFFKASFKKANRSKLASYTGPGKHEGLEVIQRVGKTVGAPTLTDIHESSDAAEAAAYVDALQIPAFLCRQTDLLLAAGQTGKIVNIKKGRFLAPESMQFAVDKVKSTGNNQVWLTGRGTTFRNTKTWW
jgi:2-dehydro-3-deoxyphosphooctonate aldolase (KDO 8-P synthase)